MIRQDAFTAMQNGAKITHAAFCGSEYLELKGGRIITSEGIDHTDAFWEPDFRKTGWDIFQPEYTALTQAIEIIKERQAKCSGDVATWNALETIISRLTELLPVERKQWVDAFEAGNGSGSDAEDSFDYTFTNPQNL